MKLESLPPAHCAFAIGSHPFEYLVGITSWIVTYRYHGAVNKTYTRTSSERKKFEEENKFEEYALFRFCKSVIWYRIRKITFHVFTNTKDLIVLEITITPEMKKEKNGHYFTIRQRGFPVMMFLSISDRKKIFLQFKSKILIKLINNTENIRNFILGNHCVDFVTYCLSDLNVQNNSAITNF